MRLTSAICTIGLCLTMSQVAWGDHPTSAEGVPLVCWREAGKFVDQEAIVYGRVILTKNIGHIAFLNFDEDYRTTFSAVIKEESFANFEVAPERAYSNRVVAVRGKVIEYKGKPEIIATTPEQITLLPGDLKDDDAILAFATERFAKKKLTPQTTAAGSLTFGTVSLASTFGGNHGFCSAHYDNRDAHPKHRQMAETIMTMNPDVLIMHGVQSERCLERFRTSLLGAMSYDHVAFEKNADSGGVEMAILSRAPLSTWKQVRHVNMKDKRATRVKFPVPLLEARLDTPEGKQFCILAVQLPNRRQVSDLAGLEQYYKAINVWTQDKLKNDPELKLIITGDMSLIDSTDMHLATGDDYDRVLHLPDYNPRAFKKKGLPIHKKKPQTALIKTVLLTTRNALGYHVKGSTRAERMLDDSWFITTKFDLMSDGHYEEEEDVITRLDVVESDSEKKQ